MGLNILYKAKKVSKNVLCRNRNLLFLLLFALFLFGCGQSIDQPPSNSDSSVMLSLDINGSEETVSVLHGSSLKLEVTGINATGERVSEIKPNWLVIGDVGTIDDEGVFTASRVGSGIVEASIGSIKDQVTVEVYQSILLEAFDVINDYYLYPERIPDKFKLLSGVSLEAALLAEYGSIEGFVNSLEDPYTRYIPAGEDPTDSILNPGSYAGVGIYIRERSEKIAVYYAMPDQPAAQAGIRTGDAIIGVDGNSVDGLTVQEVADMIRGLADTTVKLKISRDGSVLEFDVVRKIINPKNVYGELMEGNIGYLRLIQFGYSASSDFQDEYNSLSASIEGLVIDLRGNGGGYLSSAISIADKFVPEGQSIMWYKGREEDLENVYSSGGTKIGLPIVLLVDEKSASASEILAAALLEHGLATAVGEKTFGKGTIQTRRRLSDYSSLYVTIAEFFSPTQQTIAGIGIMPTQNISMTDEDFFSGVDSQLVAAVNELNQNLTQVQSFAVRLISDPACSGQRPLPDIFKEAIDSLEENVKEGIFY